MPNSTVVLRLWTAAVPEIVDKLLIIKEIQSAYLNNLRVRYPGDADNELHFLNVDDLDRIIYDGVTYTDFAVISTEAAEVFGRGLGGTISNFDPNNTITQEPGWRT